MATIYSLGLHEPSALSYLVSEGLLASNYSASAYKWNYQHILNGNSYATDEVLQTVNCVVWSRNGKIQRVFNLDIEGESITHAFTTKFEHQNGSHLSGSSSRSPNRDGHEGALVVILKTQAHIYLLSGDTHIIPLTFEVYKAVPTALGFLLQRKLPATKNGPPSGYIGGGDAPSVVIQTSTTHDRSDKLPRLGIPTSISNHTRGGSTLNSPRTFAFSELLAELSLVVSGSARRSESIDECPMLHADEEVIHVSTHDELAELNLDNSEHVYLAVTTNSETKTLTLWQVVFNPTLSETSNEFKPENPDTKSKRKSSNVYGRHTGVATPLGRIPATFRKSVGGTVQPLDGSNIFGLSSEQPNLQTGDLAAQLGHEFEQIGVQTRSARRVSSMLARTDLGGANERSAFNEPTPGALGRKSFGRSVRRGESLGGFSDRQSFGIRRTSSFQAASSVYSDGTSFLDIPASHLLEDGLSLPNLDELDDRTVSSAGSIRLPRGVAFLKLKSLPYSLMDDVHEQNDLKVITLLAPDRSTADDRRSRVISVCIMDKTKHEMTIVNIAAKIALSANRHKGQRIRYDLKAVEVQRGQSIVDACSVTEGTTKRLLILTQTREGRNVLHFEAPWTASYRVTLPKQFKVFDLSGTSRGDSPASRRETGTHRIIPKSDIDIRSLQKCEFTNQVLALDTENRCHRLRCRITPCSSVIQRVMQLCNFVLAPEFFDSILVAWWEVKRWIELLGSEADIEWTAMTVTIFILAVPFMNNLQNKPAQGPRRKKGVVARSNSGTNVDLSHWELMQESESSPISYSDTTSSAWVWMSQNVQYKFEPKSPSKHSRNASIDAPNDSKSNPFLIKCVNLAREFLQSPAGESATGPEGYLPIAVNKDRATRRTALARIVVGLHLLREELKLHEIFSSHPDDRLDDIAVIIAQIGSWLKWNAWRADPGQYYYTEIRDPASWLFESSVIDNLEVPTQRFAPPSIFKHVEESITLTDTVTFPSLLDLVYETRPISSSNPIWKDAARITPRLFAVTAFMMQIKQGKKKPPSIIKNMVKCGIDAEMLETIPVGIAAICHQAIVSMRGQPVTDWSPQMRSLLGRSDLDSAQADGDVKTAVPSLSHTHSAKRDCRAISNNAIETESFARWDASSEVDRQAVTRLIFHEDRRFQEASKLVNQTRPPIVECTPEPGWSEADLLEAQKELAVHVTQRTLSVAAGRAMMHFNARVPLLTERVPIPAFSLQCVMKSRNDSDNTQPMTLSADKALFTEDKVCWAFFHNGASAGLMISRNTRWIDTSWILYNKPPELTNRHAGFLLALGLNGHLKSLAKWVAFKYLTPKHTMTSVGLLLGLAASYLGTMDTLIARLLSVHVTRLLPVGAAELNLSPLTQTTGIMGVGLLYYNSQHRRMSEIMLSEIENNDSEDQSGDEPILRDEGYRLAAGFALGLINLGQGQRLHSLHDMSVTERLLTIAIGTKNVNLVHVLDRATAGAVIAIAFIFMKTNDAAVAKKIDIPDTTHQFDYVRPDIFLLRTLARHLIMWDEITPTQAFVRISLPSVFRNRVDLSSTKRLTTDDLPFFNVLAGLCFAMSLRFAGSHRSDVRDLLVSYLDQFLRLIKLPAINYDAKVTLNGVRNCLDVLALSCATVMAGSGDIAVMRRLRALHGRTDKETPFGSHLAAHMALGVLFLSGGTATFGTSNLAVAVLVISLYPIFPVDVLDNKGHLQALRHLWVLAVENRCLVARDAETQHIISDMEAEIELMDTTRRKIKIPGLLPEFDLIRKVSFKHENYWPVAIDFDGPARQKWGIDEAGRLDKKVPSTIRDELEMCGNGLKISLQRRAACEKPDTDTFFSQFQALEEIRGVPSVDPNTNVNEKWRQSHGHGTNPEGGLSQNPFDWIFELDTFKHLDFAERALVLGENGLGTDGGRKMLQQNVVDSALDLEIGALGVCHSRHEADDKQHAERMNVTNHTLQKDKLWQLKLLFDWTDRWEKEHQDLDDGSVGTVSTKTDSVRWMKQEVIEQLRWRIWRMSAGDDE